MFDHAKFLADRVGLANAPREIMNLTGRPVPGGYRRVYGMVLAGAIPARQENGRWYLSRSDLPQIAASLGLEKASA